MTLRALSIHQPWAWAILYAGKDVENRPWQPRTYRGPFAIQAGKTPAPGAWERLHALGIEPPEDLPTGVVLGVVDLVDVVRGHPSRWAVDGYLHWVLANPRPLPEPVPLTGKQSLFEIPADVAAAVVAQLPDLEMSWTPSTTA